MSIVERILFNSPDKFFVVITDTSIGKFLMYIRRVLTLINKCTRFEANSCSLTDK